MSPRAAGGRSRMATGLASPLSWLLYAALVGTVFVLLRPFWKEALLAFVLTALTASLWLRLYLRRERLGRARSLAELDVMTGAEFERWITAVLRQEGYRARNIRDKGDFGIDVIASVDGIQTGIQAKRYDDGVGNDAVQEVLAGCDYHACSLAVVVTQSRFTPAARAQAERARHPVVLVDRESVLALVEPIREAAWDAALRRSLLGSRAREMLGIDRGEVEPSRPPSMAGASGHEAGVVLFQDDV